MLEVPINMAAGEQAATKHATSKEDREVTNDELPAMFWDSLPESSDNPDAAAIISVLEESTPEELAESQKVCL